MTETLGEVIVKCRNVAGLSRARAAREAGISNPYLIQIEKGDRHPSETVIRKLAKAIYGPTDYMLELAGYEVDRTVEILHSLEAEISNAGFNSNEISKEQYKALFDEVAKGHELTQVANELQVKVPEPEGWQELEDSDRKLVQRLINRIRKLDY